MNNDNYKDAMVIFVILKELCGNEYYSLNNSFELSDEGNSIHFELLLFILDYCGVRDKNKDYEKQLDNILKRFYTLPSEEQCFIKNDIKKLLEEKEKREKVKERND